MIRFGELIRFFGSAIEILLYGFGFLILGYGIATFDLFAIWYGCNFIAIGIIIETVVHWLAGGFDKIQLAGR